MTQEGKAGQGTHMTDLIECPKCGHSNPAGTRYCEGCGASLVGIEPHVEEDRGDKRRGLLGNLFGRRSKAA